MAGTAQMVLRWEAVSMVAARRASTGWYAAAVVLAVAGLVVGVSWALVGYFSIRDGIGDFGRVPVPGDETITLEQAGDYVVYYESRTAADTPAPGVLVELFSQSGQRLQTRAYETELVYDVPGQSRTGRAIATFTAPEAGELRVVARGDGNASVAVGDSFAAALTARVVIGVLIALAALLAAVAISVVTSVRQAREDRSTAPAEQAGRERELVGR